MRSFFSLKTKHNDRERQHGISANKIYIIYIYIYIYIYMPGGYKFLPLVANNDGERTSTNTLALGYPPALGPSPVTFGYTTTACRCPALTFSAAINFFMKLSSRPLFRRLASFPLVLGCSHPLVDVDTESSELVQETPHPLFPLLPHAAHAPRQFSEQHALRHEEYAMICNVVR